MSPSEFSASIDERAQMILGAGWETGGVEEIDDNSYMCPRPSGDDRVMVTVLWATQDSADVGAGGGSVISGGEVNGWGLPSEVGTLDDVVATLGADVRRLLARKRRRWWQSLF
ncbi:hypothetical protein [Demequina aestuarii]|uniref:hypothetical protein n=1 Tax=Demequina aestuarii TaxID=327095 RepID=UPI00078600EA|nr:hypothetical protein [Demequina aestuarii]